MIGRTKRPDIEFVGTKQVLDPDTGEVITCQAARVRDRDVDFQKMWLTNMLSVVDEISNKKMKIVFYLMNESKRHNNLIVKTVREIAEEIGCSPRVVQETISILRSYDILRRVKNGVMMFSPDVVWRGSSSSRNAVLLEYEDVDRPAGKDRSAEMLVMENA